MRNSVTGCGNRHPQIRSFQISRKAFRSLAAAGPSCSAGSAAASNSA
ncbi:MAG: hypothetical protein HFH56_03100 [Lachnospiraceae bacterium]|nr:hypothetical protein [Lachnospiraceae bacterium]